MIQNPSQQSFLNKTSRDKFVLNLNLPFVLRKQKKNEPLFNIDNLQINVFGTIVPNVQIPPNEVRFGGQSVNVSSYSRPNYQPLTVNFVIDNRFYNYWLLWKWLNILNDARTSVYTGSEIDKLTPIDRTEIGNLIEYQTIFSIFSLNEYNKKVVEFIYYNAFITDLGSIEYNYQNAELITSTAQFQFDQLDIKLLT
jgi:hypothetical protein